MNEQQKFFKLLKYSNELKKNKKSLRKKHFEAFKVLLNFLVTIENNLHYLEKQEYIELAKDFLADEITADDFSYSFMAIYEGINRKLGQMEKDESLDLANFLKPSRPELGDLLARIYGSCDSFSPDPKVEIAMSDEKELKDCAQILLFKLQEE
jgi:hypothetical protein